MSAKRWDCTNFLAGTLLNLAVVSMITIVLWQVPPVPTFAYSVTPSKITKEPIIGSPDRLTITRLGIDLSVEPGFFDPHSRDWTLSDDAALYAMATVPPNDSNGATLLYGHATEAVFGTLPQLKPGDIATIDSKKGGETFRYIYQSRIDVEPTDTRVFDSTGEPRLVLQTCTGPWDSMRSMYLFTLESVEQPNA